MDYTCMVILFAIVVTVPSAKGDTACTSIGGTCQNDSLACSGSYHTGKCSGSASRRCCTTTTNVQDAGSCSNVEITSRDSWGARRPSASSTISKPAPYFFIHHTEGSECDDSNSCIQNMKSVQNYHIDTRGFNDIGYSFLAGDDGKIYEGRGWNKVGAHTSGYNDRSFAVSFMGNFTSGLPSQSALDAAQDLIQCGVDNDHLASNYTLYGHRDKVSTTCPGDDLYDEIQTWPHYSSSK